MKDLLVSHDERLENYFFALQESREDFNFKLNALIEAQMRNETGIDKVKESIEKLSEASQSHLQRIEKLESR
jgi:translation elongation factor EF-1beta